MKDMHLQLASQSDLSPKDQDSQDKQDYDKHIKESVGNYL
jgi:hypothetical protein